MGKEWSQDKIIEAAIDDGGTGRVGKMRRSKEMELELNSGGLKRYKEGAGEKERTKPRRRKNKRAKKK